MNYKWFLASRPKTLAGAAVPVVIGLSSAWADAGRLLIVPAVLCLLFAFVMQIDANLVNDYFDYLKGTDDENRLGPKRACAQGWITPKAMRRGIAVTTFVACLAGLPLVHYGGWWLVAVGVACVVFCFLYTTHLSYYGFGDVLVLLFFGLVPVCLTYYVQTGTVTTTVILQSLACGMVVDTLLVVNNYRDYEGDRRSGKRTLVVLIGRSAAEWLYLALGLVATLITVFTLHSPLFTFHFSLFTPLIYLILHVSTWWRMKHVSHDVCTHREEYVRAFNRILGETARNIALYGLLVAASQLLSCLAFSV